MDEFDQAAIPDNLINYLRGIEARLNALETGNSDANPQAALDGEPEIRSGLIAAGVGDPYGEGDPFTGTAMLYPPVVVGSDEYNLVGMNAGALEFGLSATTGKGVFGGGAGQIGRDGVLMTTGNPMMQDDGNDMAAFGILPGIGMSLLSCMAYTKATVANGDFETGDLSNWSTSGGGAGSISSSYAHNGTYSCELSDGDGIRSDFITSTRRCYVIDFWVYKGTAGLAELQIAVGGYDAGGNLLDGYQDSVSINSVGIWQRVLMPCKLVNVPAKVKIEIELIVSSGTALHYIDDINLYTTNRMGVLTFKADEQFDFMTRGATFSIGDKIETLNTVQPIGVIDGNPNLAQVDAGATRYLGNSGAFDPTEADVAVQMPVACTLKNLYVRTRSAQPGTGSLVFTLQINGVDTSLTATVAAGGAAVLLSDTTDIEYVTAGQRIALKAVNNASSASAQVASWSIGLFA
jgi:hypothetical protein